MKQEFLKYFPYTNLTLIALVIFLLLFIALILRVTVFRDKEVQEALARLPLEKDEKGVRNV